MTRAHESIRMRDRSVGMRHCGDQHAVKEVQRLALMSRSYLSIGFVAFPIASTHFSTQNLFTLAGAHLRTNPSSALLLRLESAETTMSMASTTTSLGLGRKQHEKEPYEVAVTSRKGLQVLRASSRSLVACKT